MNRQPAIAALRQKLIHSEDLTEVEVEQLIQELQDLQNNEALKEYDRDLIECVIANLKCISRLFQKGDYCTKFYLEKKFLDPDEQKDRAIIWNKKCWSSMCKLIWMDVIEITELCAHINDKELFDKYAGGYIGFVKSYLDNIRISSSYYFAEKDNINKYLQEDQLRDCTQLWKNRLYRRIDRSLESRDDSDYYTYLDLWKKDELWNN